MEEESNVSQIDENNKYGDKKSIELQRLGGVAGSDEADNQDISNNSELSESGDLRTDLADTQSGSINSVEHSGGQSESKFEGVSLVPLDSSGLDSGSGNTNSDSNESELHNKTTVRADASGFDENRKYVRSIDEIAQQKTSRPTSHAPRTITKEDIFHYVYGVLHNPEYRKKYEMNLKREFPRVPFYDDFWQWAKWGKELMDLHINFETVEPYPLEIIEQEFTYDREPKAKLKADKTAGTITLDEITTLAGIPSEVWEYKLGNRSALEWILDQYKEKKPKDPTIAEKFNTYRFADYKSKVIDLLMRVTTVSVETVRIVKEMESLDVL